MFDISTHIHPLKQNQIISLGEISAMTPAELGLEFFSIRVCYHQICEKAWQAQMPQIIPLSPGPLYAIALAELQFFHYNALTAWLPSNRATTHTQASNSSYPCRQHLQKVMSPRHARMTSLYFISWRIRISRNGKIRFSAIFESLAKPPLSFVVSPNSNKMPFCLHL